MMSTPGLDGAIWLPSLVSSRWSIGQSTDGFGWFPVTPSGTGGGVGSVRWLHALSWVVEVCGGVLFVAPLQRRGGAVPGKLAGQLRVICSSCFLFLSSPFGPEKEGWAWDTSTEKPPLLLLPLSWWLLWIKWTFKLFVCVRSTYACWCTSTSFFWGRWRSPKCPRTNKDN